MEMKCLWCSRKVLVTALLLTVCVSVSSNAIAQRSPSQKGKIMNDTKDPYTLTLICDRTHLAGFPLLVAVELRNVSNTFTTLPFFDLFTVPSPVSFVARGGGHEWTWEEMSRPIERRSDDGLLGVSFGPGKVWFALQDLSEVHPDIPPGHYDLSAEVRFSGTLVRSALMPIEILAPSKEDRAIATRLRATNDNKGSSWHAASSWQAFVLDNWSTPDIHELSPAGRAGLAYYLYLHRAAYGPLSIAALDPEEPWKWGHGVLEAEAAVVRLEILHAAKKPEAVGIEAAILERWPGLAWRVEKIHKKEGFLEIMRTSHGVERDDPPAGKPWPYHHK